MGKLDATYLFIITQKGITQYTIFEHNNLIE